MKIGIECCPQCFAMEMSEDEPESMRYSCVVDKYNHENKVRQRLISRLDKVNILKEWADEDSSLEEFENAVAVVHKLFRNEDLIQQLYMMCVDVHA